MSPAPRAVLYVRLSRDSAVSTSIAGQNADLYALAESEGWRVVATFEDNGKSGGKQRDKAVAALAMIRNNEADVLAVYAYDRWSRMGIADSAEVIKAIEARQRLAKKRLTPAPLFIAVREGIRSDQEGWKMRTAFAAEMAETERDRMVSRRTASIERMRREGRNPGTGPAPFGYRSAPFADGRPGRRFVVDHEEATVIREIAERLVAGESSSALARELNTRHIPMPRSPFRLAQLKGEPTLDAGTGKALATGNWTQSRVSQIWVSDHLLGRIMHKTDHVEQVSRTPAETAEDRRRARTGVPVNDPVTGLPLQAFEPILDLDTVQSIKERFEGNRGRGQQRKRRAARLLSGLIFCGACGSPMYVQSTQAVYTYYRCAASSRGIECSGLSASAAIIEDLVIARYLATFGALRAFSFEETRGSSESADGITGLTEQINATARELADEDADVTALLVRRSELIERRAQLRLIVPVTRITKVDLGSSWGELFNATSDLETRRGYLASAYDHVDIFRKGSPDRVLYFPNPSGEELPADEPRVAPRKRRAPRL